MPSSFRDSPCRHWRGESTSCHGHRPAAAATASAVRCRRRRSPTNGKSANCDPPVRPPIPRSRSSASIPGRSTPACTCDRICRAGAATSFRKVCRTRSRGARSRGRRRSRSCRSRGMGRRRTMARHSARRGRWSVASDIASVVAEERARRRRG